MTPKSAYQNDSFSSKNMMGNDLLFSTFYQKRHLGKPFQSVDNLYGYTTSVSCSFNGKEKDYESGFHYYGARYYWSELLNGWLSVDPMADKYPNVSPYNYCMWNPVKLVDPEGKEVDDDWYMTKSGEVKWDKNVKGPDDVPEGCIYLGKNPMMVTSQDDKVRILNHDGTSGEVPIHGETHISTITENDAVAVPVSVSFGTFLWDNISAAVGAIIESAVSIAWIVPACLLLSGDTSPNQDIRGGHDNNIRKSTKGKHEGGDSRRLQDQQGSKGEKIMKGERPQGYKGPWPPKKKK